MKDRILQLRIPYTISFIVKRCRKVATQSFWDAGSVAIRNVSAQQAPIAFIIHDADLLAGMTSSYPIREFDGGFWWPVRHSGGYVGVDRFSERLQRTDGDALFTIDPTAELRYHAYPYDSPASFFERVPIRKIQGSTLEARWAAAHRGAVRVMACDGLIHIEAGAPVFFIVNTGAGQLQLVAGPCSLDRTEGYQVAGPSRYDRMVAAVHGLAFGIDELSDEIALLSKRGLSVQTRSDIEVLTRIKPTSAARTLCSEQLADAIWRAGRREEYLRTLLPDALPKGALGRDLLRSVENHLPYLRGAVYEAIGLCDRESAASPTPAMRQMIKYASLEGIAAEHLRVFRNALVHGAIPKPLPSDWRRSISFLDRGKPDHPFISRERPSNAHAHASPDVAAGRCGRADTSVA